MSRINRASIALLLTMILVACIEPTRPEFQLETPFYLVEGRIIADETTSEIRIRRSNFRDAALEFTAVEGAEVISSNDEGESYPWEIVDLDRGIYRPAGPLNARVGQTWTFAINLPDGTSIISDPETIQPAVPITAMNIVFEQNSTFDEGRNRFVPQFQIFIDYDDPVGEVNFYERTYRYWESTPICASCMRGRYRNGECIPQDPSERPIRRFDYLCDTQECYEINAGSQVEFTSDELSDGSQVRDLRIGAVDFDETGGLLIEAIQYSLTPEAYEYGRIISDLVNGNSGLNPTIPAALNGNVRNADADGELVLGYLSAVSAGRSRQFLEQTLEIGSPLPFDPSIRIEPVPPPGVAPRAPCNIPGVRTSERPEGWGN
jgi:hypothetical protein